MKLEDINIRDPYVLVFEGKYYLYGTRGETAWQKSNGFDVYVSDSLTGEWSGPTEVLNSKKYNLDHCFNWAPEVHQYNNKFYMFATFSTPETKVRCMILSSDKPDKPFVPHSEDFITPAGWHCLDATLYVAPNTTPYAVFCHEHTQVVDGRICAIELSADLKHTIGEPITLFTASMPAWAEKNAERYVTDGPFLYEMSDGKLAMIWSSFTKLGYMQAISFSESGTITGPWIHQETPLFEKNGGHGMLFHDLEGKLWLTLHQPNKNPFERPHFFEILEKEGTLILQE